MASIQAIKGDHAFVEKYVAEYKKRGEYIKNFIDNFEYLKIGKVEGAFYAFISIEPLIQKKIFSSDVEFCDRLLDEEFVCCVPGDAFRCKNHFRMCFATDMTTIQEGLEKIKQFILKRL